MARPTTAGPALSVATGPAVPAVPEAAPGTPLAVVVLPGRGVALAWPGGSQAFATEDPAAIVAQLTARDPGFTWWSAPDTAAGLVAAGVHPYRCWDLAAAGRLLYGQRRDDPGALWAAAHGLAPAEVLAEPDLFELDEPADGAIGASGHLHRDWQRGGWSRDLDSATEWAQLALLLRARQEQALAALPDPRPHPVGGPLAVLTARSESVAALLAVELEASGLPLDIGAAGELLRPVIGARPADEAEAAAIRTERDARVLAAFPGGDVDLRNPAQVRDLLIRIGITVPDTRSWRLEPHATTSPAVAALLAWRKAERLTTTYGWDWLDRAVGADGRLRGGWSPADGGAGRMSAGAGLHNMPAELRPAVRAEPGFTFVRADLGQVEPRVLAVVSGDPALSAAAGGTDLYAPVAAALRCDRPTAKVAVLAAMYGQTSGSAGEALKDMDRAYPVAMAYLRAAEEVGRRGGELRTYGGRRLHFPTQDEAPPGEPSDNTARAAGYGRFARNAMIQGAAAELFKAWAATVRRGLPDLGGAIVLCLHDELLVHVPVAQEEAARALLSTALAATSHWWAAGSSATFVLDLASGPDWASAH